MPPEKVRKYRCYTCPDCGRDFFAVQMRKDKRQQRIRAQDLVCPHNKCPSSTVLDAIVRSESIRLNIKK